MHFRGQLAHILSNLFLLAELKLYFFLFLHFLEDGEFRFQIAHVIDDDVVHLFIVLFSLFC